MHVRDADPSGTEGGEQAVVEDPHTLPAVPVGVEKQDALLGDLGRDPGNLFGSERSGAEPHEEEPEREEAFRE
jgi:hypothetical protein